MGRAGTGLIDYGLFRRQHASVEHNYVQLLFAFDDLVNVMEDDNDYMGRSI